MHVTGIRHRQRPTIELAVPRQRQSVDGDNQVRNHIGRDSTPHTRPNGRRIQFRTLTEHHVPDELLPAARHLHHRCRGTGHTVRGQHRGLDLAVLDAIAAQLHLRIAAPQIHDIVADALREVTGPVHPRPARAERIRHEPLRRQTRPIQIPLRQLTTGHIHLTDNTGRHRPQP
ncbi:hypothetical protein GM1_002_01470 [Gordonia malaquae NBRC 108250]|uniref:Uncharacterized protein n=1 Tax=Gordonia malaquae NBRC 108250 TaxID=1223542 RepID=M3VD51_GORML|nr:hypothetical protein GM1_002_01470 [Gordonia malaquae NBRC 108250]